MSLRLVAGLIAFVFSGVIGTATPAVSDKLSALIETADDAYCSRDFEQARALTTSILELLEADPKSDLLMKAWQYDRLAGASEKLADYQNAERYYSELADLHEKRFGARTINSGFSKEALARVLARNGKFAEARSVYAELAEDRKIMIIDGFDPFRARHIANLAWVLLQEKSWSDAFEQYQSAIRAIDESVVPLRSGDELADLSSELNNSTFIGLGRAAWELYGASLESKNAMMDASFEALQVKWRTSVARALATAANRTRIEADRGGFRTGVGREELLRQLNLEYEELSQEWFARRDKDPAFREVWQRYMKAAEAVRPEDVLNKEKALADLSNKLLEAYQSCPELTEECNNRIADLQAQIEAATSTDPGAMETFVAIEAEVQAIEASLEGYDEYSRRHTELMMKIQELSESSPASQSASSDAVDAAGVVGSVADPELETLTIAEAQRLLKSDEALVTYLLGDEGGFIWVVANDRTDWLPISTPSSVLEEKIWKLRRSLNPPNKGDTEAPFDLSVAYELYQSLVQPIEDTLEGRSHIFVVPTGPIAGLPLHLLVSEPPDTKLSGAEVYRQASWLAHRFASSVLPSVSALKTLRENRVTALQTPDSPLIAFGDPDLKGLIRPAREASVERIRAVSRCGRIKTEGSQQLRELRGTKAELLRLRRNLDANVESIYLRDAATESRVKELSDRGELMRYRMVYFATHGLVTGEIEGLIEPALALSVPESPTRDDDGLLTASEIAGLQLNADLVVLSACNTAASERPGEETFSGLARAFLYAGARGLLVSHWPTDSTAAVELTDQVFGKLSTSPTIGRAEALRQAMLFLIRQDDAPEAAHPRFWAPFVLVGDGAP